MRPFVTCLLLAVGCKQTSPDDTDEDTDAGGPAPSYQVYAAVEGEGLVAVLSGDDGTLLEKVDLSESVDGIRMTFASHNIQGSPDGRTAWVTAIPAEGHDDMHEGDAPEQLVGIDTETNEVRSRIELGTEKHSAHVVLDGTTAYVTGSESDSILVVDTVAEQVTNEIALPPGTMPHGARLTPDGTTLVVAGLGDGSAQLVDVANGTVTSIDLPGLGVQAAVLPDGSAAFVTMYDTKQVARIDLADNSLEVWDLPEGSAGPVQIYPATDGSAIWVADQGYLNEDPAGTKLLKLSSSDGSVALEVEVGTAPHGVVVNGDGDRVWTTILAEGTVVAVDTTTGEVVSTTDVGEEPNGISCVHDGSSMP